MVQVSTLGNCPEMTLTKCVLMVVFQFRTRFSVSLKRRPSVNSIEVAMRASRSDAAATVRRQLILVGRAVASNADRCDDGNDVASFKGFNTFISIDSGFADKSKDPEPVRCWSQDRAACVEVARPGSDYRPSPIIPIARPPKRVLMEATSCL